MSSLNDIKFFNRFTVFTLLTTSFFTTSISVIKTTDVISNLSTSNLSFSNFKLAKSAFLENFDLLILFAFFSQVLLHN